MAQDLSATIETLKRDVGVLSHAVEHLCNCLDAIQGTSSEEPEPFATFGSVLPLALWAHYRYDNDWDAFKDFVRKELEAPKSRSKLWDRQSPEEADPVPDAVRHLDRINIALQVVATELNMKLPVTGAWSLEWSGRPRQHAARLAAFVSALSDIIVLEPRLPPVELG